jgi:hypothetical protein
MTKSEIVYVFIIGYKSLIYIYPYIIIKRIKKAYHYKNDDSIFYHPRAASCAAQLRLRVLSEGHLLLQC